LSSVYLPSEVVVVHCRGHQKGTDEPSEGNRLTDQATWVATQKVLIAEATEAPLIWDSSLKENKPQNTPAEKKMGVISRVHPSSFRIAANGRENNFKHRLISGKLLRLSTKPLIWA
jgi:hypothetical protein